MGISRPSLDGSAFPWRSTQHQAQVSYNPYRPPTTPVSDPVTDESPGRPLLASVIVFYYGFAAMVSLIARYFFVTHLDLVPANMRSQFQSPNLVDNAVWIVMVTVKIWAAISLFRLKEYAVVPLVILLALTIINILRYIFFKNWLVNAPGPSVAGAAIGCLLNIGILVYVARLRARGVLRKTRVP
jgi:hypothetical protein